MASIIDMIEGEDDKWDTINKSVSLISSVLPNPKARRALVLGAAAVNLARTTHSWYKKRKTTEPFIIRINENNILYDRVHSWVTKQIQEEDLRSINASAREINHSDPSTPLGGNRRAVASLHVVYDGSQTQELNIDGYRVRIRIAPISTPVTQDSTNPRATMRGHEVITIECDSLAAKRAVLKRLEQEVQKITERRPQILGAMSWGNFRTLGYVPKRPLETVVLKDGQSDRILDDLKDFLTREETYGKMGMPWRRGILLYGPPGSGKSSVATALAYELKMNVYTINISAVENDTMLMDLMSDINSGSILLLEDIDVASSMRERSDDSPGVTMSGILNALDGIATPQGLITVMTTNNLEVIDPAILRPGRCDRIEQVGYIDNDQLSRLCDVFLGYVPEDLQTISENDRISSASVVECFKRNLDDKNAAVVALRTLLAKPVSEELIITKDGNA